MPQPLIEAHTSDFYGTAKKLWEKVVSINAPDNEELQARISLYKRLLNIFQAGNYYYLLFNIYEGKIAYISPEITDVLGYEPREVDIFHFMNDIHPQDKPYFLSFEEQAIAFFKSLPLDKIKNYKAQYDLRIKNKSSQYKRILIQYVASNYDDENFYHSFHVHTDISHIKQEGLPCFSIIGLDGEPSFYNIKQAVELRRSPDIFTKREREILKCIVEGSNSSQIAAKLFISQHTVSTHRKNILGKAGCKTPVELVGKAINEGWV